MTEQPLDHVPADGYQAVLHAGERVATNVQMALRVRSRGLAWLGFWIALAVLGSNALWAFVVDRSSERDQAVRIMEVVSQSARGIRL